jgi:altronate hydrolase
LTHRTGCGQRARATVPRCGGRWLGSRAIELCSTFAVGLGCESNQINRIVETQGLHGATLQPSRFRKWAEHADHRARHRVIRELLLTSTGLSAGGGVSPVVAWQCGGLMGPGITANPALGVASISCATRRHGRSFETPERGADIC